MTVPRGVIVLMAHPDDAEIVMGGTIVRLTRAGVPVLVVIASLPGDGRVRRDEAAAAGNRGGFSVEILDLDRPSCQAEDIPNHMLVERFDAVVAQRPADLVFTHSYVDAHADHRHVAMAATAACRDLGVDLYTAEVANQYAPPVGVDQPTTYCDISDHFEEKMALIACHHSQMGRRDYRNHLLARARYRGDTAGCDLAEAFTAVRTRLPIP